MAVTWAINKCRVYLTGVKFTVITDHHALSYLLNLRNPAGRLARMIIALQSFEFEIVHRRGVAHANADLLSRPEIETVNMVSTRSMTNKKTNDELSKNPIKNVGEAADPVVKKGRGRPRKTPLDGCEKSKSSLDTSIPLTRQQFETENLELLEDESPKSLDIYEDEALRYYLIVGRNRSGMPKKQVKRVLKLAEKYYWNSAAKQFAIRLKSGDRLIPDPKQRKELVMQAHYFGHFQVDATEERVRRDWWWKTLREDVQQIVFNCQECRVFQNTARYNHPAKTTEPTGVLDQISMDIVLGLPESTEGYVGILTLIDFVSKFAWAFPIKSKESAEVSEILWQFVTTYGPMRVLRSDCAAEFTSELMKKFLSQIGVEQRVTSSYSPRANGCCERFNQTFMQSLRKFTGEKNDEWPKWVPFVLLAYRTKVHTVTKATPFELMFGRNINKFENWESAGCERCLTDDAADGCTCLAVALSNRAVQLNQLKEARELAIGEIKTVQVNQKVVQNKQHRITDDYLPVGTIKLYPKFRGPFTIIERTKNDTYIVENLLKALHSNGVVYRLAMVGAEIEQTLEEAILLFETGHTKALRYGNCNNCSTHILADDPALNRSDDDMDSIDEEQLDTMRSNE